MAADRNAQGIRRPPAAWAEAAGAAWGLPAPTLLAWSAIVALLISTEFLFQPFVWRNWPPDEIARAWVEIAAERLVVAASAAAALAVAGRLRLQHLRARVAALGAALLLGAVGGEVLLAALGSADAPSDPQTFLSEGLRWTIVSAGVALIYGVCQRARDAEAAAAAHALRAAQLQRLAATTELEALQRQIEPHFLFNTLATVRGLHRSAPQEANALLGHLQSFMGASQDARTLQRTTLGRELDLALAYLGVCQARMGERLRTLVQVHRDLLGLDFPPFSLATLVENAVTHGLSPAPLGGSIRISARQCEGVLQVSVADDGVGFQSQGGSGIGLANVRARLRALYGLDGRLLLEANDPCGVRATLIVPTGAP